MDPRPLSRDDFLLSVDILREDIKGVNDRLDVLNGRTRFTEQQIAVLKDRTDGVRAEATAAGKRTATHWGVAGALGIAVAEFLHGYLGWGK